MPVIKIIIKSGLDIGIKQSLINNGVFESGSTTDSGIEKYGSFS